MLTLASEYLLLITKFTWSLTDVSLLNESINQSIMKYSMITSTKCLSFAQNLQWESHTSYTPPTSVMWLQVWHKQTGTSTALLQKHTYKCAHNFKHSPDLWHQPRLANITYTLKLCAINPAIIHHQEKPSIWMLLFYKTWLRNFPALMEPKHAFESTNGAGPQESSQYTYLTG